ncbi:ABC transporter ATP-binding protein [Tropicimonas sp. IMCC6043]|uniref:ABC transporter ATP-binding protein n=1 Tax=Tropicimonas sp. IMCC6043 TaxID=2510645 RepID=UPI00101DBFA2|nr:sn-glycerol-3-phosphate ABC transporter ATP-binding protein UgpC [Tropicimonas sp. IMCC6043]RYH07353.1 sn-glycerol-3-phosphate ABC transporter ATP-binding protein UgpC [Tropicimonas sp. IMCC6043]
MGAVTLTGACKSYGAVEVLKGIDLEIADGEFVALVGASGCGKSTLLRMIAGLETVTAGDIHIAGKRVNDLPAKERDIAMVFQNYALYPHMTVAENMAFSLRLKRASKEEQRAAVERAAQILDLEALLDRKPKELSGGQRQRVAMGRAIVRDPQVFLFDEPLSNLDAKLRVHMRSEIKELHQRLGTTTIYVTHDQIEAMTMASRIVIMNGGIVEQAGTPFEVYDSPVNMFVAGFIGSPAMNFLEGVLERSETGGCVRLPSGERIPAVLPEGAVPGRKVKVGLRPEHLTLGDEGPEVRILVVEPTGSETQVTVGVGHEKLTCLLRERVALEANQRARLSFDPAHVHLFDSETGNHL